jgi:small subunit ribosomal protein S16
MVRIRLMRTGKMKQPSYRVVAKEARSPRGGKYIELLGFYNPLVDPTEVRLNEERISYWLSVGAQPTERVARLINKHTSLKVAEPPLAKDKPAPKAQAVAAAK